MAIAVKPNRFAEQFGYPNPNGRAVTKVKDYMTAYVQDFIRHAPFMIMATSSEDGHCDASPKGGQPGFVKVLDERHLLVPDVAGNKLFQSYQNLDTNPHVGLLFFIPGVNDTVRVNGKVTIVNKATLAQQNLTLALYNPDENATHLQGIVVEVEEAYGHCPRALKFSQLWDIDAIRTNQEHRPVSDRPFDS
ncbi:MAG: pyridoxamine 5'-phosphate oxidase family protein [Candidatus Tectomicrobia bacterium]|uniref:Pyridoxamine 5'-phosphate oxidase family protein n=1 Tax=Tectimicrobiota bacterium TaxID=2528274 RepID=A0A937VWG0_UNCTE|nr:pyridoxamine 5'-phosphate oxidase family protein [Candidatus Tectomicrobia bacterium]